MNPFEKSNQRNLTKDAEASFKMYSEMLSDMLYGAAEAVSKHYNKLVVDNKDLEVAFVSLITMLKMGENEE